MISKLLVIIEIGKIQKTKQGNKEQRKRLDIKVREK